MDFINVGVIGTGFIGLAHVEALRRVGGVKLVAIADLDIEKANVIAAEYDIPKVYHDWQDILKDSGIAAIHNCTPNNLHFDLNKRILEAGKHILSEKPLSLTSAESSELILLARKKGLVNAIDFNYRGYPLIRQARSMVESGEIGTVSLIHGHYLQDWLLYESDYNWRLEPELGGVSRAVADIGSHWFDLAQFITGLKIKRVFADLTTVNKTREKPLIEVETFKGKEKVAVDTITVPINTEDVATILIHFENGAVGNVTISQVSPGRKNRFWFEIDGTEKALSWNQEEPDKLWIGHRDKPNEILIKDPSLLSESARSFAHYPGGHPEGYPDGLKNIVLKFYEFIRSGQNPVDAETDFPTFTDGHLEIKMVDAVLKSNREKCWVYLES
ncbi:MAG: Gfo/Idh/MocA family oxidoreductase [Candidatus Marinimicrobia bacterium]|nr:Gfo/Idh/MocA family oxidoreductase [Candidatus Neomarinimicrobiota bacterium]